MSETKTERNAIRERISDACEMAQEFCGDDEPDVPLRAGELLHLLDVADRADGLEWERDLLKRQLKRIRSCVDDFVESTAKREWPETGPGENMRYEVLGPTLLIRDLLDEDLEPNPDDSPDGHFDWWCPRCPRGFGSQELGTHHGDCYDGDQLICTFCGTPVVDAGDVEP